MIKYKKHIAAFGGEFEGNLQREYYASYLKNRFFGNFLLGLAYQIWNWRELS